jgi:hypothetical protein
MPTLKLADTFGFVDVVRLNDKGAFNKYFNPLPEAIVVSNLNLTADGSGKLDKIPSRQATVALGTTAQLGTGQNVDLEIKATSNGTVSILSSVGGKPTTLFSPDLFADPISVQQSQCYVSLALNATVEADTGDKVGDLKFGFKANGGMTLSYYQLFDLSQAPPTLDEAIESTIANFAIPGDLDDVEAMPLNSVAAVDGTGDLKFSGMVSLSSLTNAPVSLSSATVGPIQITAGGKMSLGAGFELSGEYQVRIQRLAGKVFRLGFYRKRASEFTLTASASAGLGASLGQDDLFGEILKAISKNPQTDRQALAGLSPARVSEIQNVIKQSVDRTLNIGVTAEIGFGSNTEAMFHYEIDLAKIGEDARVLVHAALQGNLGPLVATDSAPPLGIEVLKTLISSAKTLQHSLKVNLLGIYNSVRISELMLKGATAWDATSGQLVLTDTATASLIGMNAVNFGVDSKKLRLLLSEQFLISAAYTAGTFIQGAPALHAQHTYFEYDARTSRTDIRKDLYLGVAFKVISGKDADARLPAGIQAFGATTVLAETDYDDATMGTLFLYNNRPRNGGDYEIAGRNALLYLVRKGEEDDYRLLTASNDRLWSQMKQIGDVSSAQFRELIQIHTQVPIAPDVIGRDYLNIVWWSEAMQSCAKKLIAVRNFISQQMEIDPNNHDFLAQKRDLAGHLREVAATTRQDFGGPWGLVAMCLLADGVANVTASLSIINQYVSVDLKADRIG